MLCLVLPFSVNTSLDSSLDLIRVFLEQSQLSHQGVLLRNLLLVTEVQLLGVFLRDGQLCFQLPDLLGQLLLLELALCDVRDLLLLAVGELLERFLQGT